MPMRSWRKPPLDLQAYILAESSNGKAVGKIRSYLNKWKPLRQALPAVAAELEASGLEHGPKFDKVLEDFFQRATAWAGRAKPEDHAKILRKLAGIKELPKKVEEKKKPEKGKKKGEHGSAPETPPPGAASGKGKPSGKISAPAPAKTATKEKRKAKPKGGKK